jgi:parallel beta-helix repeat protein
MGREIFQYTEVDASDFLRVNQSVITLEIYHTATYTTNSGAAGATSVIVAEGGGFSNGDSIYVDTNNVDINSGAGGASGLGADTFTTTATAGTFAANDAVILHTSGTHQRATYYSDPDFGTALTDPITLDSTTNSAAVFLKPGQYGLVWKSDGTVQRVDYHEVVEELDWVTVTPEHASATAGILEAVNKLGSGGGTVYIPPGTYNVTEKILISGNHVRIMGAGRERTVIFQPNTTNLTGSGMFNFTGTNGEISDLTIDMNSDNNTSSTTHGIAFTDVTDLYIHDCRIENVRGFGISNSRTGNPSTRVHIRDNHITNIGRKGIYIAYGVNCQIRGNQVYNTNQHAVEFDHGTSQDNHYSRNCIMSDNIVDRGTAATTSAVAYSGFLLAIGGGSQAILVTNNVLNDNTAAAGGTDGIGWGHEQPGRNWQHVIIDGNVVSNTNTFGIKILSESVVSNNVIYKAGTHGIRWESNNAPVTIDRTVVNGNVIIDANASNTTATNVHGISLKIQETDSGDGAENINGGIISNNIVYDSAGQLKWALGFVKDKILRATTGTMNNIIVTGNDLEGVATASVDWDGDGTTDEALANGEMTNFRFRNNITKDAYTGTATLSSGTIAVQNTNWPAFAQTNMLFAVSRIDNNASTNIGALAAEYNGTDTLTITSYSNGSMQTYDPSDASDRAENGPVANDGLMNVMNIVDTTPGTYALAQMKAPGAYTVDRMIFRTGNVTGGTSIDVHLEDSEGTPNVLTATQTLTITDDNTWFEVAGSGTAAVADSLLHFRGSGEVGDVTFCGIDKIYIVWNTTPAASGDISKVWWEFIGTAT